MTIEALLQDIADSNRAILACLQSGAAVAAAEFAPGNLAGATAGAADDGKTTTRKRRTKEEIAADEAAAAAAAKAKEAELSASATAIANKNQGNAGAADAGAAGAAGAATGGEVTWDAAVAKLKALAQDPAHGSTAVMAVIKKIDPNAANVPALKDLNKNAEIIAAIDALLNPAAAAGAEVDPLFG